MRFLARYGPEFRFGGLLSKDRDMGEDWEGDRKIVSSVREDESAGINKAQSKIQECRSKGKSKHRSSLASVAAFFGEGQEIRAV